MLSFLHFGIVDLIDIFLVAYLLYLFYRLIEKTVAEKLFYGIIGVYFLWIFVKAINLRLLGTILGHIVGVGVIAILIVFQQEIRKFLLMLFSRSTENLKRNKWINFLRGKESEECKIPLNEILIALEFLQSKKFGCIIVLSKDEDFQEYYETGHYIDALVNTQLLETIFFKNSPLHDGAVFINSDRIKAAGCVLPVTERTDLPYYLGLRHRAAIGISEVTDTLVIIVSEERGQISIAEYGKILIGVDLHTVRKKIEQKFISSR